MFACVANSAHRFSSSDSTLDLDAAKLKVHGVQVLRSPLVLQAKGPALTERLKSTVLAVQKQIARCIGSNSVVKSISKRYRGLTNETREKFLFILSTVIGTCAFFVLFEVRERNRR